MGGRCVTAAVDEMVGCRNRAVDSQFAPIQPPHNFLPSDHLLLMTWEPKDFSSYSFWSLNSQKFLDEVAKVLEKELWRLFPTGSQPSTVYCSPQVVGDQLYTSP